MPGCIFGKKFSKFSTGMVDMEGSEWKQRRKMVVRNMFNNVQGRIERNILNELEFLMEKLDASLMKSVVVQKGSEQKSGQMGEVTTDELANMLTEFTGRVICVLLFGEHWERHISSDEFGHIRKINAEFSRTGIILNHYAQMLLKYQYICLLGIN